MALVLLVDDDQEPMLYYVMALKQEGFDVQQITGPDQALLYICDQNNRRPDIIIMDSMLPPGSYAQNPECDQGLRTGVLLYPELKKHCTDIPFLVLTNLKRAAKDFKTIAPDVPVLQKIDTPPFDLVSSIKRILSKRMK